MNRINCVYLFPPHSRALSHPSSLSPPKHPPSFREKKKGAEKETEHEQYVLPSFPLILGLCLIFFRFLLLGKCSAYYLL